MRGLLFGLGILLLAAAIGFGYWYYSNKKPEVHIRGIIGSEKSSFLENGQVKSILKKKYGIVVDYIRAGSIEMVSEEAKSETDFLWPSSQVALEIFKSKQGAKIVRAENIFNSPIVIYSWDIVVDALVKSGIVKKEMGTYYIVDMPALLKMIREGKRWSDIGLTQLYGKISVTTTDPTKSNSGNMFAGLVANILKGGDVVVEADLPQVLPEVREFFARQGFMQSTSGVLFEQFLKTGVGQYPLMGGYESQAIEFSRMHQDFWPKVKNQIKTLYPVPTVWSEHPLIILNKKATLFIDALKDEEIQKIAWEHHGFRTGLMGVQNDPKTLLVDGIPGAVTKIVPMPRATVMEKIIEALTDNR
ncbi:MAG: hypothetical protein WCO44_02835 [Bacteroidota bacterium]